MNLDTNDMLNSIDEQPTIDEWISVEDRLPENAQHLGALCPRYLVVTKYGVTTGWYNPDHKSWYALIWFKYGMETKYDIAFQDGDIPKVIRCPDGTEIVTHWMPLPGSPEA